MAKQFGMDAINRLRAVFDPARYHGWGRTRRYFEGWYFKVVDAPEKSAYAFIPGIAMNGHGERHAFVQVLDGKRLTAEYHTFRAEAFRPAPGKFDLTLGDNRFTEEFIRLALPGIRGELRFRGNVPWPVRWYSPGIMGPYAFVPRMECYHGILSMDHALEGLLQINGQRADFTGEGDTLRRTGATLSLRLISGCKATILAARASALRLRWHASPGWEVPSRD